MDAESLRVDLADMEDVRAQLPRARAILEHKRTAVERAQEDYESFRDLVGLLAKRAGVDLDNDPPDKNRERERPAQRDQPRDVLALVVEFVNRENRAVRARDVRDKLIAEGHDLQGDSVRDALYYASKRREPPLVRALPGRGYYAPLSYEPDQGAITLNGSGPNEPQGAPDVAPEDAGL